ncbi:hypothetical protein CHU98_g9638 [Xylaria longipes]|nr:hypothetical protein CHU98_g9638 [Xylaria longipes]
MVDQLRKRGDIGTALLLQEILLLDKRNKPNKEISAVELRKYRDIYLQSTERLKMITGHEVPAVPPLHNLLLLTQGEVMFPSDLAQTSLEDYVGRSLLHLALDLGVMEDEPRYIEFDVTTTTLRDDWNRLPIHIACSRDSETVVEYLLNINVNLDVVDGNRRSALHYAAASGDEGIIQLLLERDANIDYKDAYGLSPLVWAAIRGHTTTVQVLAQDGVDLDVHVNRHYQMPLFLAAKKGYRDVIELLLEKGADVNFKNLLLEKGADVILKNQYSNTPLSIAIIRRHAIIVQLLLEKGAKVNLEDMDDDLYFFAAAEYGYTNVLRQLLERNSDFRYVFLDKMLRIAARGGHATTVQLLLENGADPNTEMRGHPTALQIAIDEGHKDVAEILRTTASGQHQTQIRDARAETFKPKEKNASIEPTRLQRRPTIEFISG